MTPTVEGAVGVRPGDRAGRGGSFGLRRLPLMMAVGGHVVSTHSSRAFRRPGVAEDGLLVLVRHGESEFNKQDRFTGLKNPELTSVGVEEAMNVGQTLRQRAFRCDIAFTSKLRRAEQSLRLILREIEATAVPIFEEDSLNERDYGELAGMTRNTARARWGEAQVHLWRRSYDLAPPGGESLEMTARRTLPLYERRIKPLVTEGKNVLVVAHGNSLRSIVMALDGLAPDQIINISFATGTILIYRLSTAGAVIERVEIPAKRSA
jgi:2,3-bisphosphoglycerate-dependent phosphoglycerate mutase